MRQVHSVDDERPSTQVFSNDCGNGVYAITPQRYVQFMQEHHIPMSYNNNTLPVRVIKYDGYYLFFVVEGRTVYFLDGGVRVKVDKDAQYYIDNLPSYLSALRRLSRVYVSAMWRIAMEIRSFGGTGYCHGFTVDIDERHHVEARVWRGDMRIYMTDRENHVREYKSIESMLKRSARDADGSLASSLAGRYMMENMKGNLPFIGDGMIPWVCDDAMRNLIQNMSPTRRMHLANILQRFVVSGIVSMWYEELMDNPFSDDELRTMLYEMRPVQVGSQE